MGKRIIIATVVGLIGGVVYMLLASATASLPWAIKLQILANGTLVGVAIGISSVKIKWWIHGPIMGFVFSLPLAFSSMFASASSPSCMFLITELIGVGYGLIVELFVSVVFKAKD